MLAALRRWLNPFADPDGTRRAAALAALAADPPPGLGGQWARKSIGHVDRDIEEMMYFTGGALTATMERRLRGGR